MKRLAPYWKKGQLEAGCDEAGRGCLAGPVVAAAVILPLRFRAPLLNDSKKLSANERESLRKVIENKAICYGVAFVDHKEIDQLNILQASFTAMHRAVKKMAQKPECLLIDGNRFRAYPGIPHQCFVKGDGRYRAIAAASILAKTYRDEYMEQLSDDYPHYRWKSNKGYPTPDHRQAIKEHGLSPYHRRSFRQMPEELLIPFS